MSATTTGRIRLGISRWQPTVFTLERARRALPYVARVVRDAAVAFNRAKRCRAMLLREPPGPRWHQLASELDDAIERLSLATDECDAVGADLLDLHHGVVGFRSVVEGRPVSLLWRLGEPIASAWCDLNG